MSRIAVIGTGISGLSAAWLLSRRHEVHLFEREGRPGGHTHTHAVPGPDGRPVAVDTGFIVFNRETYPNLCRLLDALGVASRESDMSFAVRCERCRLEYSGTGLSGLFAQPSNLVSPTFLGMLVEIARFNREAPRLLDDPSAGPLRLDSYLAREGYSAAFRDHYLVPMAGAVWSSGPAGMASFPAQMLVRFFRNHGFLGVTTQHRWRTVVGGSRTYVDAMTRPLDGRLHLDAPVVALWRDADGATLRFRDGGTDRFDHVVVATHADEALALLLDPSHDERRLLGTWRYSRNETLLHTDASFLPGRPAARSSWNANLDDCRLPRPGVAVTYWMNRLQGLPGPVDYAVTLNPGREIAPEKVLARMTYTHPVFTPESLATQEELPGLDSPRTSFAGAYFRYGFHEDGLLSGIRVAESFGVSFP